MLGDSGPSFFPRFLSAITGRPRARKKAHNKLYTKNLCFIVCGLWVVCCKYTNNSVSNKFSRSFFYTKRKVRCANPRKKGEEGASRSEKTRTLFSPAARDVFFSEEREGRKAHHGVNFRGAEWPRAHYARSAVFDILPSPLHFGVTSS